MPVKFTDNTPRVASELSSRSSLFLRFFAEEGLRRSRPVTPRKSGNLRDQTRIQVLGTHGTLAWLMDYAAVQEKGRRRGARAFVNYTTPGTSSEFAYKGVDKAKRNEANIMRKAKLV